ncbi:MAG: Ldh family oxidoreductase [Gemmatimonadetes bacterium]|nr:Ldh family oxidoreductase [Gemmatimonadota bacterium]
MPIFSTKYLTRITADIFSAAGMREDEARIVAKELVEANCAGHDSHGVIRVAQYLDQIAAGDIAPDAEVEIVRETPILAVLDAHWGFGQVAMSRGVELGLAKAKASGMATIAVHRANHVGRLGSYVEHIARENVVAQLFVNGSPTCRMAPWGGREARHGTNPVAIAFPSRTGEPVPDGWLLDAEGHPTNDPNTLYAEPGGTILPLGGSLGHKGYGLNIAVELLAGALGGAGCLGKPRQFRNGALLLLIDIEQMVGLDAYFAEADDYIAFVKSSAPAPGFDSILMPGEIESAMKKKRMADGIFVEEETWGQILASAKQVGAEVGEE